MSEKSQLAGASVKRRKSGLKAHATRLRNRNAAAAAAAVAVLNKSNVELVDRLESYEDFQMTQYGGLIERTILRTPADKNIRPEVIPFAQAVYELSGYAKIDGSESNEFSDLRNADLRGMIQFRSDLFLYPTFEGALGELFDEKAILRTLKANYRLYARQVVGAVKSAA